MRLSLAVEWLVVMTTTMIMLLLLTIEWAFVVAESDPEREVLIATPTAVDGGGEAFTLHC